MKKVLDVLLVLLLVGLVGYLIYADGKDGVLVGTPAPVNTSAGILPTDTFIPTRNATSTLPPASVTVPAKTAAPTSTPTLTASATPSQTLTPTASSTPTSTLTTVPTQSLLDREIADGIQRGDQIIKAIETYRAEKGIYPLSLDDLIPRYMAEIPLTVNGRLFFYRLFDTAGPMAPEIYWLAFRAETRANVTCTYLRRLDYWDCNFASP